MHTHPHNLIPLKKFSTRVLELEINQLDGSQSFT